MNAALAAQVPPKPALTIKYQGVDTGVADVQSGILAAIAAQKTEAERLRDVTNAKSAPRTADRKTDRANKRWYLARLKAYPEGTPDAALADVPTEQGVAPAQAIEILTLVAQTNHTLQANLDPACGAHATTKEFQYMVPGETEFGHTTPITGNTVVIGPFAVGLTVTCRARVANFNPGTVTSASKSATTI